MKNGTIFEYELPKGDRLILDVHPSVQPRLGDPHEPLWITEGVRKGDALASHGLCTIALVGGVWGFRGTNDHGGKVILPDWEHMALNDREVIVAFDSDLATKPGVTPRSKPCGRSCVSNVPDPRAWSGPRPSSRPSGAWMISSPRAIASMRCRR